MNLNIYAPTDNGRTRFGRILVDAEITFRPE
jgi:hypothetical protein